jgi:fibronectin-binding autotransporter adhesin
MNRKRSKFAAAVKFGCASVMMGASANAAVTVLSASGPTDTNSGGVSYSSNFTNEGNYAYAFFPTYNTSAGNVLNTPLPVEKTSAPNAFTALVALTPGSGTGFGTVGSSRTNLGGGATEIATTTDAALNENISDFAGYTYVSPTYAQSGYGMQTTYTVPAGAFENLAIYCYSLNGPYAQLTVTEPDATVPLLYSDPSSGVLLPPTSSTKQGGVYNLELDNTDNVAHTITLSYIMTALPFGVTSTQLGFEGMTAGTILPVAGPGGSYDLGSTSPAFAGITDEGVAGGIIGSSATGQSLTLSLAPAVGTAYSYSGAIGNNFNTGSSNSISVAFNGPGIQTLLGTNTYTGGTNISGGILQVVSDSNLGASTGALIFSSIVPGTSQVPGTLQLYGSNANFSSARTVTLFGGAILDTGNATNIASFSGNLNNSTFALTLTGSGSGTYSGIIGSGAGTLIKNGTGSWTLTNANTYTGSTTVNAGLLSFSGFGASAAGSAVTVANGSSMSIDSGSGVPVASVIRTKSLTLGGNNTLTVTGSSSNNSSDAVGVLTLSGSTDIITVTPYSGTAANFNVSSLTRSNFAVALINGTNLGMNGASGTTDVGRVLFNNSTPAFVGSGTTNGGLTSGTSKTLGIIPYLLGEVGATPGSGGTATGIANTFLTYNASTGLRPLDLTNEYTINSLVASNNTEITGTATASASTTINSLLMAGGNLNVSNGFSPNISSGAVLFSSTSNINILGSTANSTTGTLNFPAEAIISVNNGVTGTITGTYGNALLGGQLTKAGGGTLTLNNTGVTPGAVYVLGGTLAFQGGTSINDAKLVTVNSGATLDYTNDGSAFVDSVAGFTIAGAVNLGGNTLRSNSTTSTISGVITGSGGLDYGNGSSGTTLTISNVQQYTGPTQIDVVGLNGTTADTVKLTANNAIASSSGVSVGSTSGGIGILDLAGTTQSIASLNGSGLVMTSTGYGSLIITGGGQTFNGEINNGSGTMSLLLQGSETLTGVNNYTGFTNVSGGSLIVTSTGSLNASTPIYIGATGSATIATLSPTFSQPVNVFNAATGALNFNATSGTVTLSSTLGGTGNTNFAASATVGNLSSGVVTVAATGKFTTVAGGTLTIGGGATLTTITGGTSSVTGTDSTTTITGGALTVGGTTAIVTENGGNVTLNGAGTINNMSSGIVNLNGATDTINASNGGIVNLASNTTLSIFNGSNGGSITGAGKVNISTGKLTLSGINNYSGGTILISGASLLSGAINSLSPNSSVNISNGTLDVSGFNNTIGALTSEQPAL